MEVDVHTQEYVTDYKFHSGGETEAKSRHGADNTDQPKSPVCLAIFDDDTMLTAYYDHPHCVLHRRISPPP